MDILCESGATKSDWRLLAEGRELFRHPGEGTNISAMRPEVVEERIRQAAFGINAGMEHLEKLGIAARQIERIWFYTAGVLNEDRRTRLEALLGELFHPQSIEVQNDLLAAARAACGREAGIAAILGTGSNSCLYDGENIVRQVGAGGYILGDEGSGAHLGKLFLSDYIKGLVPQDIASEFRELHLGGGDGTKDYETIITEVYHPIGSASTWLGSLAPFIRAHYANPYIKNMVDGSIHSFIDRHLKAYDLARYPVGVVGGLAASIQSIFVPLARKAGARIRGFYPRPIEELIRYHYE